MAETSLQSAGREIATADRYQVIVSVDASELKTVTTAESVDIKDRNVEGKKNCIPSKRASIKDASPIAREQQDVCLLLQSIDHGHSER